MQSWLLPTALAPFLAGLVTSGKLFGRLKVKEVAIKEKLKVHRSDITWKFAVLYGGKARLHGQMEALTQHIICSQVLDEIVSDNDHREFVSAGVTAGIAAAFGAPVGGVLFSMEEACTFWSKKTAWRCFIAAALSVYTIQIINPA